MHSGAKKPRYDSCSDVARTINVNRETVRRWCTEGRLAARKTPGDCWRIELRSDGWPVELDERGDPMDPESE